MNPICLYCFAPIEHDWQKVEVKRTRAEILESSDLWEPEVTIPLIQSEVDEIKATWGGDGRYVNTLRDSLLFPRLVRIRVDKAEFCSDTHRKAMAGNRSAVREALGEFRDDEDDEPEPAMPGEGQGSLL